MPFSSPRALFSAASRHGGVAEPGRIERVLASVRLVLAASALAAIYIDPTEPSRYSQIAYGLLLLYVTWAAGVSLHLRGRAAPSVRLILLVHSVDILFPTVIGLFTEGPNSPFFIFFGFGLLAAAYRWGLNKTLLTGLATIVVLILEALFLTYGPMPHVADQNYDLNRVIIRAAYFAIFAFLIGYVAEQERRLRAQAVALADLSSKARFEAGLKGTMQSVLGSVVELFQARQALLAIQEAGRAYVWYAGPERSGDQLLVTWRELDRKDTGRYFFRLPVDSLRLNWRTSGKCVAISDADDKPVLECDIPADFVSEHPFRNALVNSFDFENNISTRVLLLEPRSGMGTRAEIGFLRELTRHVGPAVYNVYLLRRLQERTAAVERARVARELHDGVVQSLHAIAMRLYALRVESQRRTGESTDDLLQIQKLVQQAGADLRQLIGQLKPVDITPDQLVEWLGSTVERFRQDTGIDAKFISDIAKLQLPGDTAQEVAFIVREALVNVARHSGAAHVLVHFSSSAEGYTLVVDDDGSGFEFMGRFSHADLESTRRGPVVIKERVRAIGGELTVQSSPGQGARLEIFLPYSKAAAHAY